MEHSLTEMRYRPLVISSLLSEYFVSEKRLIRDSALSSSQFEKNFENDFDKNFENTSRMRLETRKIEFWNTAKQ